MVHTLLHHPESYSARSGLFPLVQALGARPVFYGMLWERLERRSWTAGQWLRDWGAEYYGSKWNALVPYLDEWRLAREVHAGPGDVVHFLFGEFAAPRHPGWFRKRGARLVGTFHCSARRLEAVLWRYKCLDAFDGITVMSKTQIPFFVGRGYPADRIHVTLHGVDTSFFRPPDTGAARNGPLRLLLVGSTERDHDFAAALMRSLADTPIRLAVLTAPVHHATYAGLENVTVLPSLADEGLRDAYGKADLLLMPLFDCTANNALLESVSCGTPVMVNRIGGVPEYMSSECAWIMEGKEVEVWRSALLDLQARREDLSALRPRTRAWAERFDWTRMISPFQAVHASVLAAP